MKQSISLNFKINKYFHLILNNIIILLLMIYSSRALSQNLKIDRCTDVHIAEFTFDVTRNNAIPLEFEEKKLLQELHDNLQLVLFKSCSKCNVTNPMNKATLIEIYQNNKKSMNDSFDITEPKYTLTGTLKKEGISLYGTNTSLILQFTKFKSTKTVGRLDFNFKDGSILDGERRLKIIEEKIKYEYLGFRKYPRITPFILGSTSSLIVFGIGMYKTNKIYKDWETYLDSNWKLDLDKKFQKTKNEYNAYRAISIVGFSGLLFSTWKFLDNRSKVKRQKEDCADNSPLNFKNRLSLSIEATSLGMNYHF